MATRQPTAVAEAGATTAVVPASATTGERSACCGLYHHAIELVGKRWSGAILLVLLDGPSHFSGIRQLVPELSDRLLSERLKELEGAGLVERRVLEGPPLRVEYGLTEKGRALGPALEEIKAWANRWL
jgi:DNA-binding HxlR family transcriptional regulator